MKGSSRKSAPPVVKKSLIAPAKQQKGFAVMPAARVRAIAAMGGAVVSRNSAWMSHIGAIGGAKRGAAAVKRAK